MNRREAIRQAGRFAGVAALWATLPRPTWAALPPVAGWSTEDEALLTKVGDTLIPDTPDSPGAGRVDIGRFILRLTADCYAPAAADALRAGLRELQAESRRAHGADFGELSAAQRVQVWTTCEQKAASTAKPGALNGFRHLKELTLLGYFTSEVGATKALRYDPVPGAYHGSVRLAPGDRSWTL